MAATRFVDGPAGRLAFEDQGEGPGAPVVLVHGMLGSRETYRAQIDHLKETRRAVALDLRGMGESAPDPEQRYGPAFFAEDVAAVVDALGLERFVLAGHSYGGAVITAYAARHPERIAGLLYVDAAGDLRGVPPEFKKDRQQQLESPEYPALLEQSFRAILVNASDEVVNKVLAIVKAAPREVMIAGTRALNDYDGKSDAAKCRAPKHAIAAEGFENEFSAQRAFDGVSVDVMSGVSHWLMMDRPREFNRLMDAFLARIR